MVTIKHITVDSANSGLRLEKFILKSIKGYNYIFLQKLIRTGQIRVNQKRVKLGYCLQVNDLVRIPLFAVANVYTSNTPTKPYKKLSPLEEELISYLNNHILYQDSHILAINKPKKLAVQGGKGIKISLDKLLPYININNDIKSSIIYNKQLNSEKLKHINKTNSTSAYNQVKQSGNNLGTANNIKTSLNNLKLVHRLDKETSGVLLIAKTNAGAKWLFSQFKEQKIKKTYLCLVQGTVVNGGIINAKLLKLNNTANKAIIDNKLGKAAITEYQSLGVSANYYCVSNNKEEYRVSYLKVKPKSGRNHQIRAHLGLSLNAPILGDNKYGFIDMKLPFKLTKNQIFLHAKSITFNNLENKKVVVSAPLSSEWLACLSSLNLNDISKEQ